MWRMAHGTNVLATDGLDSSHVDRRQHGPQDAHWDRWYGNGLSRYLGLIARMFAWSVSRYFVLLLRCRRHEDIQIVSAARYFVLLL